ncbi:glycine--tRNA ligase subunit beta [Elusimicrobiota bacterium]
MTDKGKSVTDFLLELYCEDIPGRFLQAIEQHLTSKMRSLIDQHGLGKVGVKVAATPSRIVVYIKDIPEKKPAREKTIIGPRSEMLYEPEGSLKPQIKGFAKAKGVDESALFIQNTPKGPYVAAKIVVPEVKVDEIIKIEIPKIISSISFPKTMRWESSGFRFARPIRSVIALWGKKILPLKIGPIPKASNRTLIGRSSVKVTGSGDYFRKLYQSGVILDFQERKKSMLTSLAKILSKSGFRCYDEADAFDPACYMTESPKVLLGTFEKQYLSMPVDIVTHILRKSTVFSIVDRSQSLINRFAVVADIGTASERKAGQVLCGYEALVRSRLFDAKFFWEQDRKNPIEHYRDKLKGIMFSRELGSVYDKTERVKLGVSALASLMGISDDEQQHLQRAVLLHKADLGTSLVGEYPDLAGKAASLYAASSQEHKRVCAIIADMARSSSGVMPRDICARTLIIADTFDTLLAHFALGNVPTATEDPMGLKKASDFLIEMIIASNSSDISIKQVCALLWANFSTDLPDPGEQLLSYLKGRAALVFEKRGFKNDAIKAVIAASLSKDLNVMRIHACLSGFKKLKGARYESLKTLGNLFKRTNNILRQAGKLGISLNSGKNVDVALFELNEEREIFDQIESTRKTLQAKLANLDYQAAFEEMAGLAGPLEKFFSSVMVMAENEAVKVNRLLLLDNLRKLVLEVLDPSKLIIEK